MVIKKKKSFINKYLLLILAVVYFISPIDLVPDVLPLLGFGDDIVVMVGTLLWELYKRIKQERKEKISMHDQGHEDEPIVEGEIIE